MLIYLSKMCNVTCVILLVVLYEFVNVMGIESQAVCSQRTVVTKWVQQTFRFTYKESYVTKCWYSNQCRKTRTRVANDTKVVPKKEIKMIKICCPGYVRRDEINDNENENIICEPVCIPACENGNCIKPGQCECKKGYNATNEHHNCTPTCSKGCENGKCIAPDKCECNFGYAPTNNTCEPICSDSCDNGYCSAPDSCECLPGYRMSGSVCMPYCSQGCPQGFCVAPENCNCKDGYIKAADTCEPFCASGCGNGTCIAPNVCQCHDGFQKNEGDYGPACMPLCGDASEEGNCTNNDKKRIERVHNNNTVYVTNDDFLSYDIESNLSRSKDHYYYAEEDEGFMNLTDYVEQANSGQYDNRFGLWWIYITCSVLMTLTLLALMVWHRRRLCRHFSGGSYVVEANKAEEVPAPSAGGIRMSNLVSKSRKESFHENN